MRTFTIPKFIKQLTALGAIVTLSACQTSQIGGPLSESSLKEEAVLPSGSKESYKVALLLPLSGQNAALGKSLRQAAEMSVFEVADAKLELIPLDTKGTPTGAQEATRQALNRRVDLILGPVFSQNARAMKPLLDGSQVPVVTYSTDLSLAEPGFFVFGFDVIEQIRAVLDYAKSKGVTSIVAIVPQNQYGSIIEKELHTLDSQGYITLRKTFLYNPSEMDFTQIAKDIETSDAQGIFIPEGGSTLETILSSLKYHDVSLKGRQLLGTGQWDDPQVKYTKAAEGGWFANVSMGDRITFEGRYIKTYGEMPHRLASLAYDSVSMAAMLARLHPENPFMVASMTQSRGFEGVDGFFRLLPNGDTQRTLSIYEIRGGSIKLLQAN